MSIFPPIICYVVDFKNKAARQLWEYTSSHFIELNIERIKNRDANEEHKYCISSATWELEWRPCRAQTAARQVARLECHQKDFLI